MSGAPDAADTTTGHLAALAGCRVLGPRRLRRLLALGAPEHVHAVLAGDRRGGGDEDAVRELLGDDVVASARRELAGRDVGDLAERCRILGVVAVPYGDPRFPALLLPDPYPPAVLFVRGDLGALARRRVGIIGTRNATRSGLELAAELGHALAAEGVAVVSGLARGVDAAAHRGTLRAAGGADGAAGPPVAVVGNGPDVPYPRVNAALWHDVVEHGLLLSEWPPGTNPDAFRFPMRNRILAACCEVLVVVESRERGGSLVTVREALERSVTVMAVPGSPRSRASVGTNALLRDGAAPVTCVDDVLVELGLDTRRCGAVPFDPRPRPMGHEAPVLERIRRDPCTIGELVAELGLDLADVAMALARLERAGWIAESGGWFEALGSWRAG